VPKLVELEPVALMVLVPAGWPPVPYQRELGLWVLPVAEEVGLR
jgi:hypothetical protein